MRDAGNWFWEREMVEKGQEGDGDGHSHERAGGERWEVHDRW